MDMIHKLRSPEGCLWDRQQRKEDVARYLMDEAYEVIDAIESGCTEALKEEMGDLLFQIFFIAHIYEEEGDFGISDIMEGVTEKMIRRHPHVFGNVKVNNIADIRSNWEDIKKHVEKRDKDNSHILAGIPRSMPALLKAQKITEKASKVGFDWEKADDVLIKIEEELNEFKTALKSGSHEKIKAEMGDLFLSLVNLCRFIDVTAEDSLRSSIDKFMHRFQYIEDRLAATGKTPIEASLKEMDDLWNESKMIEKD
jgi:tetrapyrrole methylase family protein / MazG family protein